MKNKIYAILQFLLGVGVFIGLAIGWEELANQYFFPQGMDFLIGFPLCQARVVIAFGGLLLIVTAPMTWRGGSEDETEATGEPSSAAPDQKQNKMQW